MNTFAFLSTCLLLIVSATFTNYHVHLLAFLVSRILNHLLTSFLGLSRIIFSLRLFLRAFRAVFLFPLSKCDFADLQSCFSPSFSWTSNERFTLMTVIRPLIAIITLGSTHYILPFLKSRVRGRLICSVSTHAPQEIHLVGLLRYSGLRPSWALLACPFILWTTGAQEQL